MDLTSRRCVMYVTRTCERYGIGGMGLRSIKLGHLDDGMQVGN